MHSTLPHSHQNCRLESNHDLLVHLDLCGLDRSLAASCGTWHEQVDEIEELGGTAQARDQIGQSGSILSQNGIRFERPHVILAKGEHP